MSINKIIVDTTTGAQAAASINATIDLAEAAATLGANDFDGNQTIAGSLTLTENVEFNIPGLENPSESQTIFTITNGKAANGDPVNQFLAARSFTSGQTGLLLSQFAPASAPTYGSDFTTSPTAFIMRMFPLNSTGNGRIFLGSSGTTTGAFIDATQINIGTLGGFQASTITIGNQNVGNVTVNAPLTVFGQVGLNGDVVINNGSLSLLEDMPATFGGNTVITPVASLPAGQDGQIAFSGGFMYAFFNGGWQQINTTPLPPPVEQFFSEYDASSAAAACTSETISEVWTDTGWFVGGFLWTDEGKTTPAADGFYKFNDNAYELASGEMVSETACA